MESLDLNTLANSLPTANLANAEKDLLNNFKAAALSITTLYRSSRHTSKRAYNAGYAAACQDLLLMIQQGVSVGGPEEGGMTIGRVMDWIEARLEAVKSREEEEDEDEERERGVAGASGKTSASAKPAVAAGPVPSAGAPASDTAPRAKDQTSTTPSTAPPPDVPTAPRLPAVASQPSPSLSPPTALRTIQPSHSTTTTRGAPKPRTFSSSHNHVPNTPDSSFSSPFSRTASSLALSDSAQSPTVGVGAKRRHAVMMMLDSSPVPVPIAASDTPDTLSLGNINGVGAPGAPSAGSGAARRRTRSSRGRRERDERTANEEAMDVEEDGRERKRVTRR